MSTQTNTTSVLVTGHGPFDGLGVVYGAAKSTAKPARARHWTPRLLLMTLLTGVLSLSLYFLLYEFQGDIVQLANLTRQGAKIDFIVPIFIALLFSLVHGAFTEHFWSLLGLKPKH
jgi:hypothetical protein